ncbi:single-stranded DNA-binding protein [Bacillus marasmi]|uniref:single-stranded DNA-binding protein n=1 Tax=Bacillus marasmi TaxID=1926279 RepID=UPI0011C9779D|nr:single-stranded DNA-binding protein [Bacillus marasmi]
MTKYMGLHETLEVHELLTFKNLSLTKSFLMGKLVQDPELKTILNAEVLAGTNAVNRLQQFITNGSENQ